MSESIKQCVVSGAWAAAAGVASKVSLDSVLVHDACFAVSDALFPLSSEYIVDNHEEEEEADGVYLGCGFVIVFALQGLCLLLAVVLNVRMWNAFNKALQSCSTSLEASLVTTAANIIFTASCGYLFFGESLSSTWWLGTTSVLLGIALLASDSRSSTKKKD